MDYTELVFTLTTDDDFTQDLLIQDLSDLGFESFEDIAQGFRAYVNREVFQEESLKELLTGYAAFKITYLVHEIETINWNLEWEKNYPPVTIADQVYVRASFHDHRPEFALEIHIEPKMAFGTGHHDTTCLVAEYVLELDMQDKNVLDMGCGSGILAILAEKRGAASLLAVDIDEVCTSSTRENAQLNNCRNISVQTGDIGSLGSRQFDVILANINRNILLVHLERYASLLLPGGILVMSGFYENPDLEIISARARELGFTAAGHRERNKWAAAKFYR